MAETPSVAEKRLAIQRLKDLPPLPLVAQQILQSVNDELVTIERIAQVIEQDPALTARIMGLANSAFFAASGQIKTLKDAIIRCLGLEMVKALALSMAMSGVFSVSQCPGFHLRSYWLKAMSTAKLAEFLSRHLSSNDTPLQPDHCYVCGLNYDIGLLALVHLFPEEMAKVMADARAEPETPLHEHEQRILNVDHHEAGSWLLRKWQLPTDIIHVVEFAHQENYQGDDWELVRFVRFCNVWASDALSGIEEIPDTGALETCFQFNQEDLDKANSRFIESREQIEALANQI